MVGCLLTQRCWRSQRSMRKQMVVVETYPWFGTQEIHSRKRNKL